MASHKLTSVKDSYILTIPNRSETYKKNFRLAVQKFEGWWLQNISKTTPYVSEITLNEIKRFKTWLHSQKSIKHNTASTYMNRLRTILNHAVTEKLIPESPITKKGLIEGYKKGKQESLNNAELRRFRNIPDTELSPTLQRVKYLFLFLCGTGMGYSELRSLREEHTEREGDNYIINKERNKTGQPFYVPMSNIAKYIYTNHFSHDHSQIEAYLEGLPSISYVTRMVKELARKAGIKKNLTTYVGRKTFATQWANDGNNVFYLSLILGHTNVQTTMKYVNFDRDQMLKYGREVLERNPFHSMA